MAPILILDSGIGGLSIYDEIQQRYPHIPVVYCADNAGFPYGSKPESYVIERVSRCLNHLTNKYNPPLAIVACNTASTIALPRVRNDLKIPVIGVVPAIKTAAAQSQKHCIGLLATPGTIQRSYTDELVSEFARDCKVIRVGSSELVHLAENHLQGKRVSRHQLASILSPFFSGLPENFPDQIVLGCTHFPLVVDLLKEVSPSNTSWIDSGEAIARRVAYLLADSVRSTDIDTADSTNNIFIFSKADNSIHNLNSVLQQRNFKPPIVIPL